MISGVVITSVLFLSIGKPNRAPEEVTVTQVSGEKITHSNFDYRSDSIKFQTQAEGAGVIQTDIPKANIPEAAAWMKCVHCVQVDVSHDRNFGISYWHRWGKFALGGGLVFSAAGLTKVRIGAQMWF